MVKNVILRDLTLILKYLQSDIKGEIWTAPNLDFKVLALLSL